MSLSVSLQQITFSGGESIELEPDSIIVIVGPNNAGKSATLREIITSVRDQVRTKKVVTDVKVRHSGTKQEFLERMEPFRLPSPPGIAPRYLFTGIPGLDVSSVLQYPKGTIALDSPVLERFWTHPGYPFWLANFFFQLADLNSRLQAAEPAPALNIATEKPAHPIQKICMDDSLAQQLNQNFRRAFGQELVINRAAGAVLPLHCGEPPPLQQGEDRVSPSYAQKLAKLPLLQEQGDGMRSFAGCLLQATVTDKFVVLIDEPEAFLHPPQARLLGTLLAQERPPGRQLVIATHSGDLLRGLLDASPSAIKIIRLTREGDINHASEIDTAKVSSLWDDPILRFSNTLDGLFHEQVVLCEADGDCRFYAAILDAVQAEDTSRRRPDVMFASTGGKHKMPAIAAALTGIGVPTRVVLDFDVLNAESPLRDAIEALGGTWTNFSASWKQVKAGVEKRRPELETNHVRTEIGKILDSVTVSPFPNDAVKRIQEILRRTSPWEEAKRVGLDAVPVGQERQTAEKLLTALKQLGLFIVERGEMESFDPTVGRHGNPWVAEVLRKDLQHDPHLQDARRFVRALLTAGS